MEKEKEPTVSISAEQLEAILTRATRAAREPSEEEAAKLLAEKQRLANRRATMQRMVATEEREKERRQANCSHRKPNGELCIGGQAMSNGRNVQICLRCQKVIVDEPTREMTLAQEQIQQLADQGKLTIKNGKVTVTV